MTGREEVLRSIRASLAAARLPPSMTGHPMAPERHEAGPGSSPRRREAGGPTPDLDPASTLASFARELTAAGGIVHGPASSDEAVAAALRILGEASSKRVMAWAEDQIAVRGLGEALRREGYMIGEAELPREPEPRRVLLRALGEAAVGLTGADGGVADTGSLALSSGPGRPRLAWLLPPVHVAFLSVTALYPDMASFFSRHPQKPLGSANLVFVTGPSCTGDIELILTRGVHGPKQLHVVLLR